MNPLLFNYNLKQVYEDDYYIGHILANYFPIDQGYNWEFSSTELLSFSGPSPAPTNEELLNCLESVKNGYPMHLIRELRNKKLKASDKYTISDYPVSDIKRAEWLLYRQQLRELPETLANTVIDVNNLEINFPPAPS